MLRDSWAKSLKHWQKKYKGIRMRLVSQSKSIPESHKQTGRWRTMEQRTLTHTNRVGLTSKCWKWAKGSPSIYHIPSEFFKELVERDRGFRMILMAWLFLPHPHTSHLQTGTHEATLTLTRTHIHTHPSEPLGSHWPAPTCGLKWPGGSLLPSAW